jgi:hypothetical protein
MSSLRRRIAAITNLVSQLRELDRLRERVKEAEQNRVRRSRQPPPRSRAVANDRSSVALPAERARKPPRERLGIHPDQER